MSSGQFAFLYSPHIKSYGVLHVKNEHGPCVILSTVENIDIKIEFPFPTHALQSEKLNILMPGHIITNINSKSVSVSSPLLFNFLPGKLREVISFNDSYR